MALDKSYVLCEFVNEDKQVGADTQRHVQVAYVEWLKFNEKHPKLPIEQLVREQKQVIVQIPTNHNVQPRKEMQKLTDIIFKGYVAVLLAHRQEWTEIVEALNNVVKFGLPSPSREERKTLLKRKDETVPLPKKLNNKRKAIGEDVDKMAVPTKTVRSKDKDTPSSQNSFDSDGSEVDDVPWSKIAHQSSFKQSSKNGGVAADKKNNRKNGKKKYKKQIMNLSSGDSSCTGSESDVDFSTPKQRLIDIITVQQEEIRLLKEDLHLYKAMKSITEDFPTLSSKIKDLIQRCERGSQRENDRVSSHYSHSSIKELSAKYLPKDSASKEVSKVKSYVHGLSIHDKYSTPTSYVEDDSGPILKASLLNEGRPLPAPSPAPSTSMQEDFVEDKWDLSEKDVPYCCSETVIQLEKPLSINCRDDSCDKIVPSAIVDTKNEVKAMTSEQQYKSVATMRFGSKLVKASNVSKLRHSKCTILAAELCSLLFTPEELALCSMKGKQNNKYKDAVKKQAIDEEVVEAIIEYVCQHKNRPHDEIADKEIRTAISNKLNNFRKTEEGKAILEEEKARVAAISVIPQPNLEEHIQVQDVPTANTSGGKIAGLETAI